MALAGSIVVGLALLLGALNGFRRGWLPEGMAFAGVLLGALLVTQWADRWGSVFAGRMGWRPLIGQWVASLVLLWGVGALAGYGGASLLPRSHRRAGLWLRVAGVLLGVLNAALLLGFTLRYTQFLWYGETAAARKATWIRAGLLSGFLLDQLPLVLLALAWSLAVISLLAMLIRLVLGLLAPRAPAGLRRQPLTPAPIPDRPLARDLDVSRPAPTTSAPGMERSFLEKPSSSQRRSEP